MGQDKPQAGEIEIKDTPPGAAPAPGISLPDIIKYAGLLEKVIAAIAAGQGEFIVRTPLGRKRVTITNA